MCVDGQDFAVCVNGQDFAVCMDREDFTVCMDKKILQSMDGEGFAVRSRYRLCVTKQANGWRLRQGKSSGANS